MRVMPTPADVRRLVARTFTSLGNDAFGALDVNETMRIDAGKLVARTYRTETMWAMWMIEIGLLQFYDEEGQMLCTVNLFEERLPVRAAA